MGADWFGMHPRPDVPRQELVELIEEQAYSIQALPQLWDSEPTIFSDQAAVITGGELLDRYKRSSQALASSLIIDKHLSLNDFPASWRIYVITQKRVFPPEWRLHAHRTYLPDELVGQLVIWKQYIQATQQGYYRRYLFDLYLYHLSLEIYEGWRELAELASASARETAAWAQRPILVDIRERIDNMPAPVLHPAPLWAQWQPIAGGDVDERDGRYVLSQQQIEQLVQLTRAWNTQVKGRWKIHRYREHYLDTFERFLDLANDDWLINFFAWADHCCKGDMGLFLDY